MSEADSCPAPEGVRFLPSFYEIMTTASFNYVAQVAILAEDPMPEGVNSKLVRIFRRPSGDCMPYMDVTVAPVEFLENLRDPMLARLGKRLSEDDEFSVFILGEDNRPPMYVINLKYNYLQEAIDAVGGFPIDPINLMNALKDEAMAATAVHRFTRAAALVDQIADVAMATPEIPHMYDPDMPGANLGGAIVARAHTLSFSLRQLVEARQMGGPMGTWRGPDINILESAPVEVTPTSNPSASEFQLNFVASGTEGEALAGSCSLTWDGRNDSGARVGAGAYFAVIREGEHTTTQKLILQR